MASLPFDTPRITPRIRLRRLRPGDAPAFHAYRSDPDIARYQGWDAMNPAQARAFVTDMETTPAFPPGGWWQIGIARVEDDALIGDLGLCLDAKQHEVELGITLARAAQGSGLGQAAVTAATAYVFTNTPADRIVVITDARNQPALALIARLGLRQVDTLREKDGLRETDKIEPVFEILRPT